MGSQILCLDKDQCCVLKESDLDSFPTSASWRRVAGCPSWNHTLEWEGLWPPPTELCSSLALFAHEELLNKTSVLQRDAKVIYLETFCIFPCLTFSSVSPLDPRHTFIMENRECLTLCIRRRRIEWNGIALSETDTAVEHRTAWRGRGVVCSQGISGTGRGASAEAAFRECFQRQGFVSVKRC